MAARAFIFNCDCLAVHSCYYISIIIDSDRDRARKWPNPTKRRVQGEFDKGPGFAWITKGREIENYVPPDILQAAVRKAHPKAMKLRKKGPYDNCLANVVGMKGVCDKIKVAAEVASVPAILDVLDLREQITKLVRFIHEANDSNRL